jgi:hypothetical protein
VMKAVIATILKHLANTHEYEMDQMNPVQNWMLPVAIGIEQPRGER